MLFKKRWTKEFDELLEEMSGLWGGEIRRPKNDPAHSSFRIADAELYSYPSLKTKFGKYDIFIEISNSPVGDILGFDGQDGVEYLRIFILSTTRFDILIRHERLMDKFHKALGLASEIEIENPSLDNRYFLRAKTGQGEQFLKSGDCQQAIMKLEPFDTLRITPHCLCWSQEIRDKTQLELPCVHDYTEHLTALMKQISRID